MADKLYSHIFNKVEKFDGNGDVDFASWLRTFERCCTIAGKNEDDLIKGQLLMLCLTGQSLAVAEQLEEEKKTQQKFSDLKVRLTSVFTTAAKKEAKMQEFENRIQQIEESEDEFMLSLVKLYRAANPDANDDVATKDIKRRFMNGISNEVRQSLYIFCNDPYGTTVTYQNLLEHARKAKMHVFERKCDQQSVNTFNVDQNSYNEATPGNSSVLNAIANLNQTLHNRMDSLETNYNNQQYEINAISRGNYRGNSNRFRNNRKVNFNANKDTSNWRNHNSAFTNNKQQYRCYKCNGFNHFARNCRSKNL